MKSKKTRFWVGDKVILGGNISAVITAITLSSDGSIEYRCGYFIQGIYYAYWLHDFEIEPAEKSTPTLIKLNSQ